MCGVVGWASTTPTVDAGTLRRMTDALAHRGPDGEDVHVSRDRRAGLGHSRLAIIDLSPAASQPMRDPRRRATLSFNGEIYNHAALRRELGRAGREFATDHSDTEALQQAFLHWGMPDMLSHLVGMFAFAVLDEAAGMVFLARDRVGVKPLYYAPIANGLVFASEAKALFEHPDVEARLDKDNLFHFLAFRSLPAPRTLFRSVNKLGAGEWASIDLASGRCSTASYWSPLREPRGRTRFADACDELEALIESSVEHRLEADVPVGVLLSGGLDSGLLLDLAGERRPEVDTFTAGYPGHPRFDERTPARAAARRAGSRHHEVPVDDPAFSAHLTDVAYFQDEPVAAPVCVPVYLLARQARAASVPVLLAGEGSDELFMGYDTWRHLLKLQQWDRRLPDLPGRLLRRMTAALACAGTAAFARPPDVLVRAARGQPLFWGGAMDFSERGRRDILGPAMAGTESDTYEAVIRPHWECFRKCRPESDVGGWMTYLDLRFRLPELMLARLDRMCMAHSVEGRVPFLDHRIVEFVLALPPALRSSSRYLDKRMLRTVASRRLPRALVQRRKRGFGAPVASWKSGALGRRHLPALFRFSERTGLFDRRGLERLLARAGDRLYFSLVNFMLWHLIFIENVLPESFPELGRRMAPSEGAGRRPAR
ncbi:MAG: asparagine synthase (glutamine-hydrolyzing) [Acidobacteria bacterium]|nr:asparagine synthase (glutamine-hydrolyzing) [Acidobacteriota bacterium]